MPHRVSPPDAANALTRDIAAALRASQPPSEIVLPARPNASATIGYYGRVKTLGTLFWENSEGLDDFIYLHMSDCFLHRRSGKDVTSSLLNSARVVRGSRC